MGTLGSILHELVFNHPWIVVAYLALIFVPRIVKKVKKVVTGNEGR